MTGTSKASAQCYIMPMSEVMCTHAHAHTHITHVYYLNQKIISRMYVCMYVSPSVWQHPQKWSISIQTDSLLSLTGEGKSANHHDGLHEA